MARERADNHTKDLNHQVESAQRWKSSYTLLLAKHQALTNKADMELKDRLLDGPLPSSQPPVAAPPERSTGPFMPTRILDREAPRDKTMLNEFGTQSYHQGPSKMLNDEFYSSKQGLVPIPLHYGNGPEPWSHFLHTPKATITQHGLRCLNQDPMSCTASQYSYSRSGV
ncbi:hypothetical protein P3342_002790 [Pyrenophora teres f. teres]|nr:hypothetical protein P3342_002790 [Pyrenophora teres f. teres]